MENPDEIAQNVKKKLNIVIDKLAPFKRIQVKKKTNISAKTKELFEKTKVAKKHSIETKDVEDARLARNLLATANKTNQKEYLIKMKNKLKNHKLKWKEISKNKAEESFPTVLKHNGEIVTSQKKVADIIAENLDKKIKETVESFSPDRKKAINILGKLRKRQAQTFNLKK